VIAVTIWKARPLTPEQTNRMMSVWGKQQAQDAADPAWENVFWGLYADGSGGLAVARFADADKANARALEQCMALGEFLEIETKIVLDLEQAMPSIMTAVTAVNGG
jgi:hypothetical protein